MRLSFKNETEYEQRGINTSSTVYHNGTYTVKGNTFTLTTINMWNGTTAVPNVMIFTGTISGNQMTLNVPTGVPGGGETYILTKE